MKAPKGPHNYGGIEVTDLGDMLELRCYEIESDRWRMRWDSMIRGRREIVSTGERFDVWSKNAYITLERMRQQARDLFLASEAKL